MTERPALHVLPAEADVDAVLEQRAERHGLGQGHIEPEGSGDPRGHLGHLEGVGQSSSLVVVGEHEDLGLARQAAKGGSMEDPVAIALEAGAPWVRLLGKEPLARTDGTCGPRHKGTVLTFFAPASVDAIDEGTGIDGAQGVGVGRHEIMAGSPRLSEALHRRRPLLLSLGLFAHATILAAPCIVGGNVLARAHDHRSRRRHVDVRIGIVQTVKELEVELADDTDREKLQSQSDGALSAESVLWLTDRKGRSVGVPAGKIAYIEVGAPTTERRVGFGAP